MVARLPSLRVTFSLTAMVLSTLALFPLHAVASGSTCVGLFADSDPAYVGDVVTLTADIRCGTPGGTVTFFDDNIVLGVANVLSNGTAPFGTSRLDAGQHVITAQYNPSYYNNPTETSFPLYLEVIDEYENDNGYYDGNDDNAYDIMLSSDNNPANYGQTVTFTAEVDDRYARGTVTFYDGNQTIGSSSLDNNGIAEIRTPRLSEGTHTIIARYRDRYGDSSSDSITQRIQRSSHYTRITLASNNNPADFQQYITFTATVYGQNPRGTVTFYADGDRLGSSSVMSDGTASFRTSALESGRHSITAVYSGDYANAGITSSTLYQTVQITYRNNNYNYYNSYDPYCRDARYTYSARCRNNTYDYRYDYRSSTYSRASTDVTLTTNRNPADEDDTVTFTADVDGDSPTGTVTFYDFNGTIALGTVSVGSNGIARLSLSNLNIGRHAIRARYNGDNDNLSSSSSTLYQTINASYNGRDWYYRGGYDYGSDWYRYNR